MEKEKMKKENINLRVFIIMFVVMSFIIVGQHCKLAVEKESIANKENVEKINPATMKAVVDLNSELEKAKSQVSVLLKELSATNELAKIQKELAQIAPENKAVVLAILYTESRWKYNVRHPEWNTQGIAGIRPYYWGDFLKMQNVRVNSVKACELVYLDLLKKNNGNKFKAIADYKGAKRDFTIVKTVLELEQKIKKSNIYQV